jgi:hypothetical protein
LMSLVRPLRVLGLRPRFSVEVPVASSAAQEIVREILAEIGKKCGREVQLELLHFDADSAHYRLSAVCESLDGQRRLAETALSDLTLAGIALGRSRSVAK